MSTSRDTPSSSSSAPAKRLKPMDREERIAYIEGEIAAKEARLLRTTDKIDILSDKWLALLEKEELSSREEELLLATVTELAARRNTEARLIAEIAELKQSISIAATAGTVYISTDFNLFMTYFIYSKLC